MIINYQRKEKQKKKKIEAQYQIEKKKPRTTRKHEPTQVKTRDPSIFGHTQNVFIGNQQEQNRERGRERCRLTSSEL